MKKLTLALLVLAFPLLSVASTYKSGSLRDNYYDITCKDNVKTTCWGYSYGNEFDGTLKCLWKCNKVKGPDKCDVITGPDKNGWFSVPLHDCGGGSLPSFTNLKVAERDLGDKVCSKL